MSELTRLYGRWHNRWSSTSSATGFQHHDHFLTSHISISYERKPTTTPKIQSKPTNTTFSTVWEIFSRQSDSVCLFILIFFFCNKKKQVTAKKRSQNFRINKSIVKVYHKMHFFGLVTGILCVSRDGFLAVAYPWSKSGFYRKKSTVKLTIDFYPTWGTL